MGTDGNKKVVRSFFDAIANKDRERIGSLMTDDATWWISPTTPVSGTYSKADFLAIMPQLFDVTVGKATVTIGDVTAEDNRVSVTGLGDMQLTNGKLYANHYHYLIYLRDGKISAGREYSDTAHMSEIFGSGGVLNP